MNRALSVTPLLLLAVVVACQDPSVAPAAVRPVFATAAAASCPAHATFVVSDELALLSAVGSAQPHDTIAVSGMIEMTFADVFVETDGLTFTCATPGSGLRAAPAAISWLFVVLSKHVTVESLTLDASNTLNGAVVAFNGVEGPFTGFAEDVRLVGNDVICAGQHLEDCVSIRSDAGGLQGALISANTFEANTNNSTIGLYAVNGSRVDANTIRAGSGWGIFLYGVNDARLEENTVEGGSGLFGLVLFGSGDDIRLIQNHFLCAVESCVHIESDPGSVVQRVLISGNHFQADTQLAIFLGGVNDARVEGNTIEGALGARLGNAAVFVAVSRGRLAGNSAQCADACVFAARSPGLVIASNQFESAGSSTGIHLQEGTDGDSVVGNTIVATVSSFVPQFGGIRVRDGASVVVADNIVRGPWANSIAATDLTGSDFERNTLQDAASYGLRLSSDVSSLPVLTSVNVFRANRASGAGSAGMFAQFACNNQFIGNALQRNAGNVGAVFDVTTGANTLVGDGTIVVDNGSFDCNCDGVPDPNVITGLGPVRRGVPLAAPANGARTARRGIALK